MPNRLDLALAALNGLVGDHLARTHNPLATALGFVVDGQPVGLGPQPADPRVVVLVHGWMADATSWSDGAGGDFGRSLARDRGLIPLYVRYNSGLPIADNGAALAAQLDALIAAWPDARLVLLGHSMGGLVIRAATHVGGPWVARVDDAIYVGTPHTGAPLERVGRVVTHALRAVPDPITQLVGQIADLRSDGVKDLGDADLRHEDRARREVRISLRDPRNPVPLLPGIRHHAIAGALEPTTWLGDGVVPVDSAAGDGLVGDVAVRRVAGVNHVAQMWDARVYAEILDLLGGPIAHDGPAPALEPGPAPQGRLQGARQLVEEGVDAGTAAVGRAHLGTTARTFHVLGAVRPIAGPVAVVRAVHDASTAATYATIRGVNFVVGRALEAAIGEPPEDAG